MSEQKHPNVEETPPHLREFLAFLPELSEETDRGMALITTSFIDELLRRVLLAYFIEGKTSSSLVEGFNAPLGTLATRASAAVALGLVSYKEFAEIEIIRKIRNKFAHHVHVSFKDASVSDLCKNLVFAAQDYDDVTVDPRGRFSTSAVAVIMNLTNRPHYVALKRVRFEEWAY